MPLEMPQTSLEKDLLVVCLFYLQATTYLKVAYERGRGREEEERERVYWFKRQ